MQTYPKIYGFNHFSEAGPDAFSPSIFLGGCNLKCPYCMNSKLVLDAQSLPTINIEEIKKFVIENKCEWLNISGGEITIQPTESLIVLLEEIKSWGCRMAISTNGVFTDKIRSIIEYIDYVTVDIKTSEHRYYLVCEYNFDQKCFSYVVNSLNILREQKTKRDFNYEIRTTLYRPLVGIVEINDIGLVINNGEKWVLQPFRKAKNMLSEESDYIIPYTEEEVENLLLIARKYTNNASIRMV
jgi:pyruvate formate lyase activating enzyme